MLNNVAVKFIAFVEFQIEILKTLILERTKMNFISIDSVELRSFCI